MTGDALFDVVAVHCCFCAHVVRDPSPQGAHDLMEKHYQDDHKARIAALAAAIA